MSQITRQQLYEVITEQQDALSHEKKATLVQEVNEVTKEEAIEYIQRQAQGYLPLIVPEYRRWSLVHPEHLQLPAISLFLLFFRPILELLLYHTNNAIRLDPERKRPIRPIMMTELRRWLACRLQIGLDISLHAEMQNFWSSRAPAAQTIGYHRWRAIESYICLSTDTESLADERFKFRWYYKVAEALDILRQRFKDLLIPSSHVAVDESIIEFHGRKADIYKLPHKPQGEGFVLYCFASHEGMIHDFIVASSQEGLEGVEDGITIDTITREQRQRKRNATGTSENTIHLPSLRTVVFLLCQRVITQYQPQSFVCFVDNLFADVQLAKALLTINIGLTGTTRLNTVGTPPQLLAIRSRFSKLMKPDEVVFEAVDDQACVINWHDPLSGKIVMFTTTAYRPHDREVVSRRYKPAKRLRTTTKSAGPRKIAQPVVATNYNDYMGSVDLANQLRASKSVRRPRQPKWTKKFLEFIIDCCQVNAFLIWRQRPENRKAGHREHDEFVRGIIAGLLWDCENVHTPSQHKSRLLCAWKGCQVNPYTPRQGLGEVINGVRPAGPRKTTDYCDNCMKTLCVSKGCFTAYHNANRLPSATE